MKTQVDTRNNLVCAMFCTFLFSCASAEAPSNDIFTAMDTLEKFNNPENFFATRKNFDVAAFRKNAIDMPDEYEFVREDGVHVEQTDFGKHGYKEEFTRPDSHYRYSIMYTTSGQLSVMGADFCRNYVKETLVFNEKGEIVEGE